MTRHRFPLYGIFLFAPMLFAACNSSPHKKEKIKNIHQDSIPKTELAIRGNFSDQKRFHTDSDQVSSFFLKFPLLKGFSADVNRFYAYRQYRFAWYDQNGLTEQADNLFNHLNNLEKEGIQTPAPYKDSLDKLFNDPLPQKGPDPDIEILLTAEYFFYAEKVWQGIPEKESTKLQWYLPRKKLDLPHLMDSLLKDSSASLFSPNFSYRQYNLLKAELQKYRRIDSAGIWKSLLVNGRVFRKNDSADIIHEIRHRLFLLGDLMHDSGTNGFDDSLEHAVKAFQQRYGLDPDGVMGAGFFREINIPVQEDIRKIIVNMERTRWVPVVLSNHYLIINIPAFTLSVYDQDTMAFKMNVVVGKDIHKTVVFNGDLKYVVFSPYWNIPASIMKKEILPAIRKDPDYLKKNNMEWIGNRIRQKPGPSNALGLVKFLFPNSYNIYLHDSPAKSLFGVPSRAFSHGCIRLSEPKKLAEYLLRNDPKWTDAKITAAMHRGREQYVELEKPVPVFIAYLTAWVDNHGKLNFRKDIYKRDEKLEEMIIRE